MSSLISKTIKYDPTKDKLITLACGCFWGTEHMFRKYLNDRIVDCKVGYANGAESKKDSAHGISYKKVCGGDTDFAEVLQVSYNPKIVTLKELTDFFFRIHDPTTSNSQGPDQGTQYRSGLFAHSDADLKELAQIKAEWQPKWGNKIATLVEPIKNFYDAEEYHQLYLDKNPQGYACPTHYLRDI
ncbi:hypothetical protein SUVZ_05G1150 [Saccharomyces uvarum]|uniref:peptide-methionine (S)-S-oxide reductase n=1 Tax=Saccharomyces uvarum TaxID=230603 RepID=A0ABN8WT51_SACUV|nr:hypothetical protein SUVZ_05G1150 [Saccharomyces uvarum]